MKDYAAYGIIKSKGFPKNLSGLYLIERGDDLTLTDNLDYDGELYLDTWTEREDIFDMHPGDHGIVLVKRID